MEIFAFIGIIIIFLGLQTVLLLKTNKGVIRYLPLSLIFLGLLFSFITYIGVFGTYSSSVIAENQYLALFLSFFLGGGLIGCIVGIGFYKALIKRQTTEKIS